MGYTTQSSQPNAYASYFVSPFSTSDTFALLFLALLKYMVRAKTSNAIATMTKAASLALFHYEK